MKTTNFDLKGVSLITKVINRPDCAIIDEATGEPIAKDTVKAIAIISDNSKWDYLNSLPQKSKRGRKSKEEDKEDEVVVANPNEIDAEEDGISLDGDEDIAELSEEDTVSLIAGELKINVKSITALTKNGWYAVPTFDGMREFRPLVAEPIKNGFRLILKKEVIFSLDKCPFPEKSNWGYNPCPFINEALEEVYGRRGRFYAAAPYRYQRFDDITLEIKQAVKSAEMAQKTRIKVGNNLVAIVYNMSGNIAFNEMKEAAAADKGKALNDTKVLDLIEDEFHFINATVDAEENNIDKQITKLISKIMNSKEPEEEVKNFLSKTAIRKYRKAIGSSGIKSNAEMKEFMKNHKLNYIKTYGLYTLVREYLNYLHIEKEAIEHMTELVHSHKLWQNYLIGIRGCGEVTAAHIIANFNINIAEHPSSFLRYCGLDQIIVKPEEGYEPTKDDMVSAMALLRLDCVRITRRAQAYNQDDAQLSENFARFSTDAISRYDEYTAVKDACTECGIDIESALVDPTDEIKANIGEIMLNNTVRDLILNVCKNHVLDHENTVNGVTIPVIRKRARTMRDKEVTTYLSKDGTIKTKAYLGYNAQLKGKLMGVLFGVFLKQKDSSGYAKIYYDYRARLEQRPDIKAKLASGTGKLRVHNMARRRVIQEFLKDLWLAWRAMEGLPLNGGTYEEAKLGHYHRQGNRPELLAEPKRLKREVTTTW